MTPKARMLAIWANRSVTSEEGSDFIMRAETARKIAER
jgi:hypothetical protein